MGIAFKIPVITGLLTRAAPTGYDRRGRTVLCEIDKHPLTRKPQRSSMASIAAGNMQSSSGATLSSNLEIEMQQPVAQELTSVDEADQLLLPGSEADMEDLMEEFEMCWDSSHELRR